MWFTADDIVLEKQNFCPEVKLHLMINITDPGPSLAYLLTLYIILTPPEAPLILEAFFPSEADSQYE